MAEAIKGQGPHLEKSLTTSKGTLTISLLLLATDGSKSLIEIQKLFLN